MNRIPNNLTRLLVFSLFLVACGISVIAQDNPFAPEKPPVLPPGMTGANANDARAKLSPGMYDAGEIAVGMKHIALLKKPDAFQLGTDDPSDPRSG